MPKEDLKLTHGSAVSSGWQNLDSHLLIPCLWFFHDVTLLQVILTPSSYRGGAAMNVCVWPGCVPRASVLTEGAQNLLEDTSAHWPSSQCWIPIESPFLIPRWHVSCHLLPQKKETSSPSMRPGAPATGAVPEVRQGALPGSCRVRALTQRGNLQKQVTSFKVEDHNKLFSFYLIIYSVVSKL